MVLDPIPQSLPVHFFGSRPQPPTSRIAYQHSFPCTRARAREHTRTHTRTHTQTHLLQLWARCCHPPARALKRDPIGLGPPDLKNAKYAKKDRYKSEETCINQKRPTKIKRDLHKSKETCINQKRPI